MLVIGLLELGNSKTDQDEQWSYFQHLHNIATPQRQQINSRLHVNQFSKLTYDNDHTIHAYKHLKWFIITQKQYRITSSLYLVNCTRTKSTISTERYRLPPRQTSSSSIARIAVRNLLDSKLHSNASLINKLFNISITEQVRNKKDLLLKLSWLTTYSSGAFAVMQQSYQTYVIVKKSPTLKLDTIKLSCSQTYI